MPAQRIQIVVTRGTIREWDPMVQVAAAQGKDRGFDLLGVLVTQRLREVRDRLCVAQVDLAVLERGQCG
jgi:hypothetical protein